MRVRPLGDATVVPRPDTASASARRFPATFLFVVATSAYQIEGAHDIEAYADRIVERLEALR